MATAAPVEQASAELRSRAPHGVSRPLPWLATMLGLAAAYAAVGEAGLRLSYPAADVPLTLPGAGVALGALLLGGVRLWPGVALGQLLLAWFHGQTLPQAALVSAGHTLAAVVGAGALGRIGAFDSRLGRPRDVLLLAALGGAAATVFAGLGHGLALTLRAGAPLAEASIAFAVSWLAACMGVMVIAPLLLVWRTPWPRTSMVELVGSFALLLVASASSFGNLLTLHEHLPLAFAPFPFLIWVAMRQGTRGAAVAVAAVAAVSLWGTLAGHGPFETVESATESIALLWSFTAIVALTTMLLASANTQQRRSRQRLADREARMRAILQTAVDAIVTVDERGRIESFNRAAEEMFGYPPGEATGAKLNILVARADAEACERLLQPLPAGDRAGLVSEIAVRRKDGTTFPARVSVGQMPRGGGRRRARRQASRTLIFHDITERNRLEAELRQSQKMEAVGTLASGVAHDINNLLMGIIGCAELSLEELTVNSPAHERVRELKAAALGGRSIVRQLMAFGRKRDSQPQVFSLDEAIADNEAMLCRLVGEDVKLTLELGASQARLRISPGHIEQVLMNLVVNARQAMPHGGEITVTTAMVAEDDPSRPTGTYEGEMVRLRVRDTGVGMDEQTRARAFEPFFTTRSALDGTGLGLSTVYGIVKRAGGYIAIDSELDRGTSFSLLFPAAVHVDEQVLQDAPSGVGLRAKGTILVVEDDDLVRHTVQRHLESLGFQVLAAADGPEALTVLSKLDGPLDGLLADMVLPRMSGPMVAEDVHEQHPDAAVVFMSAYSLDSLARHRGMPPVTPALQKPFTLAELLTVLRESMPHCFQAIEEADPGGAAGSAPGRPRVEPVARSGAPVLLVVEDHEVTRHAITKLFAGEYRILAAKDGAEAIALCVDLGRPVDLVLTDLGLPDMHGDELVTLLRRRKLADRAIYMSGRSGDDPNVMAASADRRAAYLEKPVDFEVLERTIEGILAEG